MLDIVVIGSGPAGMSAAIYGKRANLQVLVLEKEYEGTGQIAESSQVDNYLGYWEIDGFELGEKFRQHAEQFGVEFKEGEVHSIRQEGEIWKLILDDQTEVETRTVIYAAGATHRRLGVEGEERLAGKGVSYCATCDGAFFKDKTVVVVGGGDTALDDALYLAEIAEKVYVIHRRNEFRGAKKQVMALQQKENVSFVLNANVKEIKGENTVTEVVLDHGETVSTDAVFVAIGMEPQTQLVKEFLPLDAQGYVIADETGKTEKAGFFVAGDARTKSLRQVVTAVADGANAATSASQYLK